jgi:hypothetical protein
MTKTIELNIPTRAADRIKGDLLSGESHPGNAHQAKLAEIINIQRDQLAVQQELLALTHKLLDLAFLNVEANIITSIHESRGNGEEYLRAFEKPQFENLRRLRKLLEEWLRAKDGDAGA